MVLSGTSLMVQWLRLLSSQCREHGFNPWWGTKIPHAAQYNIFKKGGGVTVEHGSLISPLPPPTNLLNLKNLL